MHPTSLAGYLELLDAESWAATEGATNAGAVTFQDAGNGQTSVQLTLEYEPEGLVEKVGDKLNIVENQAERDLERFKAFIESEGYASGAWRGSVSEDATPGTPGVEDASGSRGDSGKAGVSGKAVAAGVGAVAAAAAGAVAAGAAAKKSGDDTDESSVSGQMPLETDTVASTGVGYDDTAMPPTTGTDYSAATGAGTSALGYDRDAGTAGTAYESTTGAVTPEDEDRLGFGGTEPESRPTDR
jgi:hypothetical protein